MISAAAAGVIISTAAICSRGCAHWLSCWAMLGGVASCCCRGCGAAGRAASASRGWRHTACLSGRVRSVAVCSNSNAAAGSLRACRGLSQQRGTARCIALHCYVLQLLFGGICCCCQKAHSRAAAPAAAVAAAAAEAVADYSSQTLEVMLHMPAQQVCEGEHCAARSCAQLQRTCTANGAVLLRGCTDWNESRGFEG